MDFGLSRYRKRHPHNIILLIILLMAILLVNVFRLAPEMGVVGDAIYEAIEDSSAGLEAQLIISEAELSSCQLLNEGLLSKFKDCSAGLGECRGEIIDLNTDLGQSQDLKASSIEEFKAELWNKEIECRKKLAAKQQDMELLDEATERKFDSLRDEITELKEEVDDLESGYDSLAKNTADNLCCKARVDNPKISYYKIDNDRVVCLEEGTDEIDC